MTRIGHFWGDPRAQVHRNPTPPPRPETPARQEEMTNDIVEQEYQEFEQIPRVARRPTVVMVNRNQDPDQVVQQVRHDAAMGEQNQEAILEQIIVQNGVSPCLQRPTYSSPLPDFVLQTELPWGWKVLKFAKFVGDTEESIVEHVAMYQNEVGDIVNNEDLNLKYFPSSLTKTLKELDSVKRTVAESVDQYLNRFRLLKARCFTQVPKHELVDIAAESLDYSIRKKMDTQYVRDMAQLANRV
ncbi:uncharacterized protein LOC127081087 [Lathyrus oleraceus]|uniref:uncharacterized protein LOC127081087 n=1 Tax=Pisum sativum TaxID=3888 RepID=UPI0021D10E61|nr:uncharacterized protein LOC127081087 [Pisum sativum]